MLILVFYKNYKYELSYNTLMNDDVLFCHGGVVDYFVENMMSSGIYIS